MSDKPRFVSNILERGAKPLTQEMLEEAVLREAAWMLSSGDERGGVRYVNIIPSAGGVTFTNGEYVMAWRGPGHCPYCGAVDQHEHRTPADGETP